MTAAPLNAESRCRWFSSWRYRWVTHKFGIQTLNFHLLTNKVAKTVSASQWQQLVSGRAEFMESSGACNLKGAVGREAAIVAPIIKLLWSPARESECWEGGREGGREGEKRERETWARKPRTKLPLLFVKWFTHAALLKHLNAQENTTTEKKRHAVLKQNKTNPPPPPKKNKKNKNKEQCFFKSLDTVCRNTSECPVYITV